MEATQLEPFDAKHHQRKAFGSGNEKLDEYLKKHLSQGVKKSLIQADVSADEHGKILGYYTLSAASVNHASKQALVAADTIGVLCMIVDAKPEAVSFYQRFGFQRLIAEGEHRLYLSAQTIRGLC